MNKLLGLTYISRARLTKLIRGSKGFLTPNYIADELKINRKKASLMLAYYARSGWLSRVKNGLYAPLTLETSTTDVVLDNPWLIASKCFDPCYIGGWTAIEYWGFTEQLYNDIMVYTTKGVRNRAKTIQGVKFCLRSISSKNIFGTKNIWINGAKVLISDPSRTIVDALDNPSGAGGIREIVGYLNEYLKSEYKNISLLMSYCEKLGKGVIYKRLGFLLEHLKYKDKDLLQKCITNISKGKSRLDPKLDSEKLVTRWQLWVPENWEILNDTKE